MNRMMFNTKLTTMSHFAMLRCTSCTGHLLIDHLFNICYIVTKYNTIRKFNKFDAYLGLTHS